LTLQHFAGLSGGSAHPKGIGYTEGGEALLVEMPVSGSDLQTNTHTSEPGSWYALWTHSHCEQQVCDQLVQKGFRTLLPTVDVWSRRRGVRRLISAPMFPSYLFVRTVIDKSSYLEVVKVKGLVCLLGESWDRLTAIPDEEMQAIEQVSAAHHPVLPYPYLKEGQRARITGGPLAGVEGILVESRPQQGVLVLSLHLLHRSVAVVVDGTDVVPA
jgi:transcriptional antiterminator NusG